MNNLSTTAKKVIIIAAGALVLLLAIFLVFRPNLEKKAELKEEIKKIDNEITYLKGLEEICAELRVNSDQLLAETQEIEQSFSASMPQEKVLYEIHKLVKETGISISSITPQADITIFSGGYTTAPYGSEVAATEEVTEETESEESAEDGARKLSEMVGKSSPYQLQISGTERQIMLAINWFDDHEEYIAISGLNLSFDASTGKLSGTMDAHFFSLEGNGKAEEIINIPGVTLGNPKIFGTFEGN